MKTEDGTLNVELTYMGYRCGCLACGRGIDKFEIHGVFGGDALVDTLCCRCVGRDFRPLLHAHGSAIIASGQELQELAARPLEDWALPTEAEIAAYRAEVNEAFRVLAEEEGIYQELLEFREKEARAESSAV